MEKEAKTDGDIKKLISLFTVLKWDSNAGGSIDVGATVLPGPSSPPGSARLILPFPVATKTRKTALGNSLRQVKFDRDEERTLGTSAVGYKPSLFLFSPFRVSPSTSEMLDGICCPFNDSQMRSTRDCETISAQVCICVRSGNASFCLCECGLT